MEKIKEEKINNFSNVTSRAIFKTALQYGTPVYLYDEQSIIDKCEELLAMPNAYGLTVRYAMKANSSKAILRLINKQGLHVDASSLNEAKRARLAGILGDDMSLTSQELQYGEDMKDLETFMWQGLKYNVCSLRQLYSIGDFAADHQFKLAIRIHPGVGSGESATRNTGDDYSCFGIHLSDLPQAIQYASEKGVLFDHVHVHIGSGADPDMWRSNIDLELSIIEKYFPNAETVSFGGGLKEARMPGETAADIQELGAYAKKRIEEFYERTGRKLKMEIEPGTYVIANAGYAITQIMDRKRTGEDGFNFIVLDGGMDMNSRPLLYGSQHPFYVIDANGKLLFSEFLEQNDAEDYEAIIVGRCCETGDSQCLNTEGVNVPRKIVEPGPDDVIVIGGAGAYCSSMAPFQYNSLTQAPEVMLTKEGELKEIRTRQTLKQLIENELYYES